MVPPSVWVPVPDLTSEIEPAITPELAFVPSPYAYVPEPPSVRVAAAAEVTVLLILAFAFVPVVEFRPAIVWLNPFKSNVPRFTLAV